MCVCVCVCGKVCFVAANRRTKGTHSKRTVECDNVLALKDGEKVARTLKFDPRLVLASDERC